MTLLLDTHIWIWAMHSPEKLSRAVQRQLRSPKNELYLSPVSIWEVHHLVRRGRLRIKTDFEEWLNEGFSRMPIREAPLNFAIAAEAARIHLPQPDLVDLFLAATASVLALTLVTADHQLIHFPGLKILADA